MPAGKVILTISGKIGIYNVGDTASFDREMLKALDWSSFTTSTPWYDAPVTFAGVSMAKLMQAVRAEGETVVAGSLNDYETKIPMQRFQPVRRVARIEAQWGVHASARKGPAVHCISVR